VTRKVLKLLIPNSMRNSAGTAIHKIKTFASWLFQDRTAIGMWERRAKQYGTRAVLNIGHTEQEIDAVTAMQKQKIFPFLKHELRQHDKKILDLGCGPGRFTPDLAELIQGNAIGVDPIRRFLDIAPKAGNVEYRLMKGVEIPVPDKTVDIVWISLVLGGIIETHELRLLVSEVNRVLRSGGLIVLIENTAEIKDGEYWKFRSLEYYQSLFQYAELKHCSDYFDLGERISILVGRKYV